MDTLQHKSIIALGCELAAAGRKAAGEGLEILRRAREQYRIQEHEIAPRPRPWPTPVLPPPPPPAPDYYLTGRDRENLHALERLLELADTARAGTCTAVMRSAAVYVRRLREGRDRQEWLAILRQECRIGRNRADRMRRFAEKIPPMESNGSRQKAGKIKRRAG